MKKIIYFGLLALTVAACEQEKDKVAQLKEYKAELKELQSKIAALESEIEGADTLSAARANDRAVLVSTLAIEKEDFKHLIEVRGSVESRRNVMINAEVPGSLERVYIKEGEEVRKGQKLLELDASVIKNNIATLKTQLELAETVFERQARLWEQNIGTEIQYLEAKNRKETLEREVSTAYSQLAQYVVTAPFNGIVDEIPAREGEMIQPGMPMVRLVNPEQMYIDADISERYIGKFKEGDKVEIIFPSQDKIVNSTISAISNVINRENRTFSVEVQLPKVEFKVKPNQVAVLRLSDYSNEEAISVPTKIIRSDMQGQYVFTLKKEGDYLVADKKHVKTGLSYKSRTEIVEGLEVGDLVIDKGINELNEGVQVRLADEEAAEAVRMASGQ